MAVASFMSYSKPVLDSRARTLMESRTGRYAGGLGSPGPAIAALLGLCTLLSHAVAGHVKTELF